MKVVFAPDKFAGTLTASEAASAMADGWSAERPQDEVRCVPMADGGPGTVQAVAGSVDGSLRETTTVDQLGRPVRATWLAMDSGTALIEVSSTCRPTVAAGQRRPDFASTFGVGRLIGVIEGQGFSDIVVGLGGSATVDGGLGAAIGLGAAALADSGHRAEVRGPVDYDRVASVTSVKHTIRVTAAADVSNPLLGESGAARVFGPQKGADADMVELLEQRMGHLADIVEGSLPGGPWRDIPGAGAAGGLGFGLLAWTDARVVAGAQMVADMIGLGRHVEWCDLIVTGEGSLDAQTLDGKAPRFIADLARTANRRPAAIAGYVDTAVASLFEDTEALGKEGLVDPPGSVRRAASRLARTLV